MIADRRFQHYAGPRLGMAYAFYALVRHSIGWVLGWKRSARYKIVPALMLVAAFLPSVIVVVVAAVVPANTPGLPTYLDLYVFVLPAVYLFVALTGPELVCPDRRYGTLRMYVTSNLGAITYVAAKLVAVWAVLAIVTVGPALAQAAGYAFVGRGASTALEALKVLAQVAGAGLVLAVFFGTLALAAASLTDRNSFASAGIILGFVLTAATIGILQGALRAPDWVMLLAVNQVPLELVTRIYQAPTSYHSLPNWEVAAATAGWIAFGMLVLLLRYRGEGRR